MANAEIVKIAREVTVVKTIEEDVLQLNLSMEEAYTLKIILDRVGGDPNQSPRLYAQNICSTIREVGKLDWFETDSIFEPNNRSIHFKDNSLVKFKQAIK